MDVLCRCDRRMLRYVAGVRWQDGKSSNEVAEMCGVEDLFVELRKRRLRWFGHVKRAGEGVLKEVEEVRVGGWRPVGRLRKNVEWVCDGGYEYIGDRGRYGTRSDVENSHRLSYPILIKWENMDVK